MARKNFFLLTVFGGNLFCTLLAGDVHTSVKTDRMPNLPNLHLPTHLRPGTGLWWDQQAQLACAYSVEAYWSSIWGFLLLAVIPLRLVLLCFPFRKASEQRLSDLLGCLRKNNPNLSKLSISSSLYLDKIVGRVASFYGAVQELSSPRYRLKRNIVPVFPTVTPTIRLLESFGVELFSKFIDFCFQHWYWYYYVPPLYS